MKVVNDKIRIIGKPKILTCDCCELEVPIPGVRKATQYDGIYKNLYTDDSGLPWTFATSPDSDHVLVFCGECCKAISDRMLELETEELDRETVH